MALWSLWFTCFSFSVHVHVLVYTVHQFNISVQYITYYDGNVSTILHSRAEKYVKEAEDDLSLVIGPRKLHVPVQVKSS